MIRNLSNLFKRISISRIFKENQKLFHNKNTRQWPTSSKLLLVGGSATFLSSAFYFLLSNKKLNIENYLASAICLTNLKVQDSVYSQTKKHALYLTIHLNHDAPVKEIAKIVCQLQKCIDIVCPTEFRDEDNEILAGVGFGPNFFNKARSSKPFPYNFSYYERKGQHGSMPSTGGDIFIHAKSGEFSKLFELAQLVLKKLPENSVNKFEDIYGWVYQNGRDLSGFIDGTENPPDEDHRKEVAVNEKTGGSFVIAQKWIHRHNVINREKDSTLESWIGRKRSDSTEIKRKSVTSHVARMTGGPNFEQQKKFEIVRQSQPFGTLSEENGLFFIAYSSQVEALDYMLNQMVGASGDSLSDDVMRITNCVKSTYWYFPGVKELEEMIS